MIDMFAKDIVKEIKRFAPADNEQYGVVNLDVAVLFPFENQEMVKCNIGVISEDALKEEKANNCEIDTKSLLFTDTCLNHRYANFGYLTLSKKQGRKVCKIGYPVISSIKSLNNIRQIVLQVGTVNGNALTLRIPVSIKLTNEKSVCGLNIVVHGLDIPSLFGIELTSEESVMDEVGVYGGVAHHYYIGDSFYKDEIENSIKLKPCDTKSNSKAIIYDTKVELYSQSPNESLFL